MKTRNFIKSLIFLIAILFSFSINAYNSLRQCSNSFDVSLKKVNVNVPFNNSITSIDIIFEELENENDNENSISEAFLVLPFFSLAFNSFQNANFYFSGRISQQAIKPIFLAIRSIRI